MVFRARVAAIEFDRDEVRLAVVKTGRRLPKVLELHSRRAVYSTPEQRFEALVAAVKSAFADVKYRPAAIVLCMSSSNSMVRTLTIPFRGARKVASAVRFELEPYLAIPIEELAVDFSPVLEADGQTDVLAVGVRRTVLEEQLGILNAAGIEAEGADIDALALTGMWRAAQARVKGLHAVLHVRAQASVLAVVCNKTMAYFRHLNFGADGMRTSPAGAAREVLNSLRAFQAGWRGDGDVATLSVTGEFMDSGSAEAIRAWEAFLQQFEMPVTRMNLLDAAKASEFVRGVRHVEVSAPEAESISVGGEDSSEDAAVSDELPERVAVQLQPSTADGNIYAGNVWEAVIAAAQGAAGGGFSMNFREGDLAPKSALRGMASQVMATSCLALLLLAGVASYYYYGRMRNVAECASLKAEIEELENQVVTLKSQGISLPGEIFSDPSLLDILREIASKIPDDKVPLSELKMDKSTVQESGQRNSGPPAWFTIRGQVKDDNAFSQVVAELKKSEMFDIDEPDRKREGDNYTFKIVAHRKAKAGGA